MIIILKYLTEEFVLFRNLCNKFLPPKFYENTNLDM